MVAQLDSFQSSSLAFRGSSSAVGSVGVPVATTSVVGGTPSSRSRRYNRSHVGGTSYVPLNEFPTFSNTGDVEIVVRVRSGHENRYLLHRDTLARCSGFFEASTSKEWSRAQVVGDEAERQTAAELPLPPPPPVARLPSGAELARLGAGGGNSSSTTANSSDKTGRRWRYELDLGQDENDKPILVQKEEDSRPTVPSQSLFGGGGGLSSGHSLTYRGAGGGSKAAAGPTHSNSSFFRSVANLTLSREHHSSSRRHGSGHHSSSSQNLTHGSSSLLPAATADEIDILRDYDNLFRIMYNYAPLLDGINIADAYVQCKSLLAVADEYDALGVVGPRVDHHLLQFQSRLWRQIAKYPISYLRLGYLARSRVIFQEAVVHVVGQWPAGERSLRAAMPDAVLDLIEDKVDELAEAVARVESRLFRLHLTTRGGERVSPSTSYLDWLAVSLFRQWLADNTTPPAESGSSAPQALLPSSRAMPERRGNGGADRYGHRNGGAGAGAGAGAGHHRSGRASSSSSTDSGGRMGAQETAALALRVRTTTVPPLSPPLSSLGRTYRTLGTAGGLSFLGHDECKRFLKMSPDLYSRDNLRRFEKRIDEMKAMAREIVRPLMGSGLELDMGRSSGVHGGSGPNEHISYFTCTYLSDRDLPWYVEG
ncbi:hypothetical protein CMQ_4021 [Grosmannia clavigera kw1407]|uniref:BTB domain-containing protein n=1 Tax=Grosmannia clavigera (strain kw1407 / UAMH 11150) TaxID=655863 RepID=F0XA51_GROCL|nr:uncharacterized protein CMQ_4021 [Grosmannia clavigera kw1407]EFX05952.1 hypothetical protein CMQ_4021 [Grosmannia clavigera kw1407]